MLQRRPPLRLEELGPRIAPSAMPLTVPLPPAPPALTAQAAAVHILDGQGHGTYRSDLGPSDAGAQYHINGVADLAGMGRVRVTGTVTAVGFTARGRAHGTLTFSGAQGSVTVELLGKDEQAGFSALPEQFTYKVVGGAGAYAHLSGGGALRLDLEALPTGDLPGAHGTFTLAVGAPTPQGSR